jgi:hypothetical protein
VKEGPDQYLGPPLPLSSNSTAELARLRVESDAAGASCRFTQFVNAAWAETGPGALGGAVYREEVELVPSGASSGDEYSVLFYDARNPSSDFGKDTALLPFTTDIPFGVALKLIPRSA